MRTPMAVSALALAAACSAVFAAEELKSGLQVGDPTEAYNVRDITGSQKGKTLCYR